MVKGVRTTLTQYSMDTANTDLIQLYKILGREEIFSQWKQSATEIISPGKWWIPQCWVLLRFGWTGCWAILSRQCFCWEKLMILEVPSSLVFCDSVIDFTLDQMSCTMGQVLMYICSNSCILNFACGLSVSSYPLPSSLMYCCSCINMLKPQLLWFNF